MHSFRIEIHELVESEKKTPWWVVITGSGAIFVRTTGKCFATEREAIDYAKGYLSGDRERPDTTAPWGGNIKESR